MGRIGRFRSGFTLVELLMVVAIIAILAGILFPILTRTKAESRRIRCASNLQQLGRAFHLYVSDWNSVYPAPGGRAGDHIYWAQSGRGGLVGYIGRNGGAGTIWCCPELTKWHGRYEARTYSMNSYLRNPPDIDYPSCTSPAFQFGVPENKIEVPGRTILLYEGMHVTMDWPDSQDYIYRCGNWTCVRGWFTQDQPYPHTFNSWLPWHSTTNNYLYVDGHVRSFRPNQWPNHPPFNETNEWWVRKTEMARKMKGW